MISGLEEVYSIVADKINDTMLLGQSSWPDSWGEEFEGFRFADPFERVSHYGFDQRKNADSDLTIRLDPVPQVVDKLGLEDSITLFLSQALPRDAVHR